MATEKVIQPEISTTHSVIELTRQDTPTSDPDSKLPGISGTRELTGTQTAISTSHSNLLTESQAENIISPHPISTEETPPRTKEVNLRLPADKQTQKFVECSPQRTLVVKPATSQHSIIQTELSRENVTTLGSGPAVSTSTAPSITQVTLTADNSPVQTPLTPGVDHAVHALTKEDLAVQGLPRETFKCAQCDYCSHNKHYLKQHVDLVHNADRPFKCPFCDYAGKRSHSLKEHLVVHSNNRPYECGYCNATFRKKGHLTNHIKMHTTQKAHCGLCTSEFTERSELFKHIKTQHPSNQWYGCDVCDYVTWTRTSIIMHMHTHSNPKTYMCSVCKFTSVHTNIMKEHMECHNGGAYREIPTNPDNTPLILLRCSECGFTTHSKETLKSHMWEHLSKNLPESIKGKSIDEVVKPETIKNATSQSTYKCSDCSYVCNESVMFITHMLSQHKPKTLEVSSKAANADIAGSTRATSGVPGPVNSYTHDAVGGFYRCMACGYTSEHQRTIKSHMWRHSGSSSIDYPMFQNGPLSIYEDTPIGLPQKVATNGVEIVKNPFGTYTTKKKKVPTATLR